VPGGVEGMAGRALATPTAHRAVSTKYANQVVLHVALIVFAFLAVAPFVWMVFGSFKSFKELTTSMALLQQDWTLANYAAIVNRVNFLSAYRNSVVVAFVTTILVLTTSSLVGYVFAKYRFPGRDPLF